MSLISFLIVLAGTLFSVDSDAQIKADILREVNSLRENGCTCGNKKMPAVAPVIWNATLEKSSQIHANDMLQHKYFSHYDRKGKDIGQRAEDAGYHWRSIGENIAEGQVNVNEVIQDWLGSYDHCTLIMSPKFKEMGVSKVGLVWVQHFGTPR